jgi:hypothetical protein
MKLKTELTFKDQYPLAARLSLQEQKIRPVTFRPYLAAGLALSGFFYVSIIKQTQKLEMSTNSNF